MKKIAFICVHNSCRSQIAEAFCRHLLPGEFQSYSAGTELAHSINADAMRLMKALYGIDLDQQHYPKLLSDIPPVDIVITMGCNVECPSLPCQHREDWGIDDPTEKSDEEFAEVIRQIREKVLSLTTSS